MRSWVPPFQVGDKAVRIGESAPEFNMFNGHTYTVTTVEYCCTEMGWRIGVAEASMETSDRCTACSRRDVPDWRAIFFVKPDEMSSEHTVDSLLEELNTPLKELEPIFVP